MDKVSQIADAYRVLLDAGRVRNKKEFAALLCRHIRGWYRVLMVMSLV